MTAVSERAGLVRGQKAAAGKGIACMTAGAILLSMTLLMNGTAIWIRYRYRKKINW